MKGGMMIDLTERDLAYFETYRNPRPRHWRQEQAIIVNKIDCLIDELGIGGVTFARVIEELPEYLYTDLRIAVYENFDTYRRYHPPKILTNERGTEWLKKSNHELYIQRDR